jgi:hypothetical protein
MAELLNFKKGATIMKLNTAVINFRDQWRALVNTVMNLQVP